jgi:hypothetical protein
MMVAMRKKADKTCTKYKKVTTEIGGERIAVKTYGQLCCLKMMNSRCPKLPSNIQLFGSANNENFLNSPT